MYLVDLRKSGEVWFICKQTQPSKVIQFWYRLTIVGTQMAMTFTVVVALVICSQFWAIGYSTSLQTPRNSLNGQHLHVIWVICFILGFIKLKSQVFFYLKFPIFFSRYGVATLKDWRDL